jgi:DNA helicase TIP49 (TBP-interacting protein)
LKLSFLACFQVVSNRIEEGEALKAQELRRSIKVRARQNNEGYSGTIYNANNGISNANSGTCNQTYCRSTTYDIAIGKTTKGIEGKS